MSGDQLSCVELSGTESETPPHERGSDILMETLTADPGNTPA